MDTILALIVTAIIGGVIGWLASIVMGTNAQMGTVANVVVGIVGAGLGRWIAGLVGFVPHTLLAGALVALLGAAILIGLLKVLGVLK